MPGRVPTFSIRKAEEEYHRRELEKICPRIGGEFIDGKCVLTRVNDELRSNYNYNGWRNYETWAVNLFLSNDYNTYRYVHDEIIPECEKETLNEMEISAGFTHKDKVVACVADRIKEMIDENEPELDSPYAELLRTDKVNYWEIAKALVGENE